jgi:Domain of unknown function (DUF6983)
MTTYVPFSPPPDAPQQFPVTLDGAAYTAVITWLYWSQRWYVNLFDGNGNRVFTLPMIESPQPAPLASLVWDPFGYVTATVDPIVYLPGSVVRYTIAGASPDGYNGTFDCVVQNPTTFTYPLATDPGQMTRAGTFCQEAPISAGYFSTSTLIWRPSSGNFEINP